MTVTINFKTDKDGYLFAYTWINGNYYCEIADTFNEAKEKLVKRLQEIATKMPTVIPEPEEVEI